MRSRPRGTYRERLVVLGVALLLDVLAGEPPAPMHPVVGLGRLIERLEGALRPAGRERPARAEFGSGLAVTGLTVAAAALPAVLIERQLSRLPQAPRLLALAGALKPSFAVRALFGATSAVEHPLGAGDLPAARAALSRVVSRDVAGLDETLIAAAAIESLAENMSDSIIAPLAAYLLGGLPLAYAYRAANTLDAMLGYRGANEYFGKTAAMLDDLLNLLPARLTALLLTAASPAVGARPRIVWRVTRRERRRTASPNAGWPMAAAAAALGVCLEKRRYYRINPGSRPPQPEDLRRALLLCGAAGAVALGLVGAMSILFGEPPNAHSAGNANQAPWQSS